MRVLRVFALLLAVMGCLLARGARADDPMRSDDTPLAVGKEMPFHVADFVNGKSKDRAGCPAVMISNSRGRGLIIWTRDVSEPAFRLARALDAELTDGDKLKCFLVAFDANVRTLAARGEGLSRVVVGRARRPAKETFEGYRVDPRTAVLVFLLDRQEIRAVSSFAADELSDGRIREVVAGARKFAAESK